MSLYLYTSYFPCVWINSSNETCTHFFSRISIVFTSYFHVPFPPESFFRLCFNFNYSASICVFGAPLFFVEEGCPVLRMMYVAESSNIHTIFFCSTVSEHMLVSLNVSSKLISLVYF